MILRWSGRAGRSAPLAVFLLLAACATDPRGQAPAETTAAEPTPPEATSNTARLPETLPDLDDDPEKLIGLGPDALTARLGMPELVRREAPAEIWQYRTDDCVFDLFLYERDGGPQVTYLEARDGEARKVPAQPCLNQILRAQLEAASS